MWKRGRKKREWEEKSEKGKKGEKNVRKKHSLREAEKLFYFKKKNDFWKGKKMDRKKPSSVMP